MFKKYVIAIFLLLTAFQTLILSDSLISPVRQLQTQQVMTSLIRSRIEYLIQTYHIFVIIQ